MNRTWSFSLAGSPGEVDVVVAVNDDPEALGCRPAARGFPYCSASIRHAGRGYAAALGWIQLVRSTDGGSAGAAFEPDPFEPLGPPSHPFAFFGFLPTLFGAPSRDPIRDMDWTAHSFLGRLDDNVPLQVHAVLGFSWGFAVRAGTIAPWGPRRSGPGTGTRTAACSRASIPTGRSRRTTSAAAHLRTGAGLFGDYVARLCATAPAKRSSVPAPASV